MNICGACSMEVMVCPECGGKMCSPGCPDRADDGCTCMEIDEDKDPTSEEEESEDEEE
jgi:hypothetical protein